MRSFTDEQRQEFAEYLQTGGGEELVSGCPLLVKVIEPVGFRGITYSPGTRVCRALIGSDSQVNIFCRARLAGPDFVWQNCCEELSPSYVR